MNGKVIGGAIVAIALVAGAAIYYLQVYGYYEPVAYRPGDVELTVLETDAPEEIPVEDFQGIDADSSPLRYRACFTVPLSQAMLTETYEIYDDPTPLTGPDWFDCYDAGKITEALGSGEAIAFLSRKNIHYGVDRVVAVFGDGRAFAWHQLNKCGDTDYAGNPTGEACPPREDE